MTSELPWGNLLPVSCDVTKVKDVFKTCMVDTWSRGLCHTFCKDMVLQKQIFFISTQKDVRGFLKIQA